MYSIHIIHRYGWHIICIYISIYLYLWEHRKIVKRKLRYEMAGGKEES